VSRLDAAKLDAQLDAKGQLLVYFYLTDKELCPTCSRTWTMYVTAAMEAEDIEGLPSFGAIDCSAHAAACAQYGATQYPAVLYLKRTSTLYDEDPQRLHMGDVSAPAILGFAYAAAGVRIGSEKANEEGEPGWEGDNGAVVHLGTLLFSDFQAENTRFLTMFHAPWCGHCKALKPTYVRVSVEAAASLPLAAVDCTVHRQLCNQLDVKGFPTILEFKDGEVTKYEGARSYKSLYAFATQEKAYDWGGKAVKHLSTKSFKRQRRQGDFLAMFYAPWCGHCKKMKPSFTTAAEEAAEVLPLAAIDCTENRPLCAEYDIKSYPTLKYFGGTTRTLPRTARRARTVI